MCIKLLPWHFKYTGLVLLIPGLVLAYLFFFRHYKPDLLDVPVFAVYSSYLEKTVFGITQTNLLDELALLLIFVGLFMLAFSYEKNETELIMRIRFRSLYYSFIANFAFLVLATLTIYGTGFIAVISISLFSQLVFYVLIFRIFRIIANRKNKTVKTSR